MGQRTEGNGEVEHNGSAEHLREQRLASSHRGRHGARGSPMAKRTPVTGFMAMAKAVIVSGEGGGKVVRVVAAW